MATARKHHLRPLRLPWWDFIPLIDWGDPALEDNAALGFSLLPRQMDAPMLEHARTWVTVTCKGVLSHTLLSEKMHVVPQETDLLDHEGYRLSSPPWEHVGMLLPAALQGLRSHERRHGKVQLAVGYHLHREWPLLYWQVAVANNLPCALQIERATLLRVGPPRRISRHRRGDFIPSRFRLFRLRRPPKAQSAYYDLTERFGSLRLHPLDAPAFDVQTLQPEKVAFALGLEAFSPAAYGVLLRLQEDRRGLLVAVGGGETPLFDFDLQVNTDPLAPGLTLRMVPRLPWWIGSGDVLPLPPVALAWLQEDDLIRIGAR